VLAIAKLWEFLYILEHPPYFLDIASSLVSTLNSKVSWLVDISFSTSKEFIAPVNWIMAYEQ